MAYGFGTLMKNKRRLFCQLSPLAYKISYTKCCFIRYLKNKLKAKHLAHIYQTKPLAFIAYSHKSLIRRKLGNVDMALQENKATNLALASKKINCITIKPGEIFSFWYLVGSVTTKKGYKTGLTIKQGAANSDIGGGLCQFTNLIHWLVLHSPLNIIEHHHHDGVDLFPDFNRQVPFGCGTSIMYNYLDYRFSNPTQQLFQLVTYLDEHYLCAELRSDKPLLYRYHIKIDEEYFTKNEGIVYRHNRLSRAVIDSKTGNTIEHSVIKINKARVCYDSSNLPIRL